jgi:HD-GYP domain-containing protein (c-di-GMP phosphodiesterase class II)
MTTSDAGLRDEIEAVRWLFDEVRAGKRLPVMEAEAVVHCLYSAMPRDDASRLPAVTAEDEQQSMAAHAINVALTAMAAAESMVLESDDVRAVGLAGLLHDVGMVRVPPELVSKSDPITPDERALLMRHPADGATIILEAEGAPDVAVVAAYEHHLKPDGSGYPRLMYMRGGHNISRLIAVCAGYHALTAARPFRSAWSPSDAITILQAAAGRDYDAEIVDVLTAVLRRDHDAQGS